MTRVLVVGSVTHDRCGKNMVPGGCAFYGARVYRGLGADAHLVTSVGTDFRCEEMLRDQPSTVLRAGRTTLFSNYYPVDRPRVQVLEASASSVTPESVSPALLESDVIHLAPVLGEVSLGRWKAAARSKFLAISVQGWIKRATVQLGRGATIDGGMVVLGAGRLVVQEPWAVDATALQGIRVACLSEEDLIGQGDLLRRLCDAIPIVACTLAAKGCHVISRGKVTRIGVFSTEVVDPTGAGDAFAAAFVYRLAHGDCPTDAARYGAAAASVVVEAVGGAALWRMAEVAQRFPKVPILG